MKNCRILQYTLSAFLLYTTTSLGSKTIIYIQNCSVKMHKNKFS